MRRANSIIGRSIEEKKEHLFIKQASDYLYWCVRCRFNPEMGAG